jgi:hypothetical protein
MSIEATERRFLQGPTLGWRGGGRGEGAAGGGGGRGGREEGIGGTAACGLDGILTIKDCFPNWSMLNVMPMPADGST